MRQIPVSPEVTFIGTGKAAARAAYAELSDGSRRRIPGEQAKDDSGVPLYVVDVLYLAEDSDRAEICGVRVAAWEPPVTKVGQIVRFIGLVAVPYVDQRSNRVALSFRAEGVSCEDTTVVNGRKSGHSVGIDEGTAAPANSKAA